MTDKELVESLLKKCGCKYSATLECFINTTAIDNSYVKFNNQNQCTYLDLYNENIYYIPDELLELKYLKYLDLRHNNLTYIPKKLNYIKELYTMYNPIFKSKDKIELLFNKVLIKH